jgi:polyisoprenoid-binding protein YceI
MDLRALARRPPTWIVAVPLLVLAAVLGGAWLYANVVRGEPEERLALEDTAPADGDEAPTGEDDGGDDAGIDGTWEATEGSEAGYRVDETLFGQSVTAAGRTTEVAGTAEASGTTISSASFTVDVASITSDDDRRDNQFRTRIMDAEAHPDATFELTEPVELEELPPEGEVVTVPATGELTVRGTTNEVTVDLDARRAGETLEVNAAIPVVFADYGIPDASFGPAVVEDRGEIELLVVMVRQP